MTLSVFTALAENKILHPSEAAERSNVAEGETADNIAKDAYIGFKDVDLTGMNSLEVTADVELNSYDNGCYCKVVTDDPVSGEMIGWIIIHDERGVYTSYITPTSGVHDVYIVGLDSMLSSSKIKIKSFEFKKEAYVDTALEEQIPDSAIKDYWSDTWQATDSFGRKVADYSEAGPVKEGRHEIGMMYWNWHRGQGTTEAKIISEVLAEYPDAVRNAASPAWKSTARYYWDEPALGYYSSFDYFVYCRHFEMLSAVGVDCIFMDFSNNGRTFMPTLEVLVKALRDTKARGVDVPRLSLFNWNRASTTYSLMTTLYSVGFVENDWSDIWYMLDGKPLIFATESGVALEGQVKKENTSSINLLEEIDESFTWRVFGGMENEDASTWTWIESFPQLQRGGTMEDGRPEFMAVGVSFNQSYVNSSSRIASDDYAMGRGYSNVFGEDYSADGARTGQYFKEQAAHALKADPHFIYVDGWNEFTADLQTGAYFVDAFTNEDSRDIEPSKGLLKDDYYMLLADFIRKYKGVRPAPVAGEAKTIDISGDISQWDSVTPSYYNYSAEDRDSESGYLVNGSTVKYTTNSGSRVTLAKVSRDGEKLYFMAQGGEAASLADTALYINADRNAATGHEGYNFVIGRNGTAAVEAISSDGAYTEVGTAEIVRNGNTMQLSVSRALLGLTGTLDFEFKFVAGTFDEVIELYENQNTAPIGRFNYLYTEIAQSTLKAEERKAVQGTSLLVAGKNKMVVSGSVVTVNEKDTTKTPFEMNGTLYIPKEAFEEILGYGESKTVYDSASNIFKFYKFAVDLEKNEVSEENWYYTVIGTYEARANGYLKTLSAPVITAEGGIYLPVSIFSDCMGLTVSSLGGGAWAIGNAQAAAAVLKYLN